MKNNTIENLKVVKKSSKSQERSGGRFGIGFSSNYFGYEQYNEDFNDDIPFGYERRKYSYDYKKKVWSCDNIEASEFSQLKSAWVLDIPRKKDGTADLRYKINRVIKRKV